MTIPSKLQPASQAEVSDNLAYLAGQLRAIGQRATPQRLMILAALETGEHLTADEVYCRIAALSPVINRSTVYRTLELFRDLGVISETDLGGGVRQFELLDQHRHHHLVCHDCGAIIEIDDAIIEPLRQQALHRYGFAADIDHLALFGRCRHCAGR